MQSILLFLQVDRMDSSNKLSIKIQREMTEIEDMVNRNFISNYEIAAQNICNYVLQDRRIDFKNKLEQAFLNMLIAGETYYKL